MAGSITLIVVGVLLRIVECLMAAAPTLLIGAVLAGLFRAMLGDDASRRMLGPDTWRGRLRAVIVAPLFPVCAVGALPLVREFHRSGVARGNLVAFALAAALLNPFALAYGLTALPLSHLMMLLASAITVAMLGGAVACRGEGRRGIPESPTHAESRIASSGLVNLAISTARIAANSVLVDCLMAAAATAVVCLAVPEDWLPEQFLPGRMAAVPLAGLAAAMQYVAPPTGIMQFSAITRAGVSSGAGLTLYLLGVGLNAATLWCLSRIIGGRRTLGVALVVVATCLALGWISEAAFRPMAQTDTDMHALESLARPHLHGANAATLLHVVEPLWSSAVPILFVLSAAGLLLRWFGVERLERTARLARTNASGADLKRWHTAAAGLLIALALLTGLAYVLFPAVEEIFADMSLVRANAMLELRAGHAEGAIPELEAWDRLAGKLPVSLWIRGSIPGKPAKDSTTALRRAIRAAREAAADGRMEESATLVRDIDDAYHRCRAAYEVPL